MQSDEPIEAMDLVWAMVVLTRGMKRSMVLGRAETAERGSRYRGSYVIAKVFGSRTELRLENEEKNFKFNVGGEGKPMKLL